MPTVEADKAAQARGEAVASEYRVVRPDGEVRWIYDRSFPVGDGVGRRSAGIASDVTARRLADAAARDVEERLRQFGEASSDILWVRNADTLQWEYLSPAFETIYGLSRNEALTGDTMRNWADLIVPEDRERAIASIKQVVAGERVTFEYRICRPVDGQARWLRNTDFPMRDANGHVTRIGGVGQDVTELKAIEATVAESEARLRTLMTGIPQLVWRSANGGQWTWSSPQWRSFTGQSATESLGLGWLEAIYEADRVAAMEAWDKASSRGIFDVEYRVRRASDGAYLWHHTRSLPVRNGGDIVEWLGTTTDVQQLKELQERQSVMVAELQHRTRNLIAVVRSIASQTMQSTGPTEAFRDEFNHRMEALARVQGLLSRADEEPITIEALIRLELEALGADLTSERVRVEGPPVRIRNSVVQTLSLALHELATNARKYGALSNYEGVLDVTWHTYETENAKRLALEWREVGGNSPDPSGARKGCGRELIERALPYALSAKTRKSRYARHTSF